MYYFKWIDKLILNTIKKYKIMRIFGKNSLHCSSVLVPLNCNYCWWLTISSYNISYNTITPINQTQYEYVKVGLTSLIL